MFPVLSNTPLSYMKKNNQPKLPYFACIILLLSTSASAQMITGVWKGKINRQKAEVKIIQNGDSLIGTAYYYESASNYRRYSIKGFFDINTNEAVWWDDQLIEERTGKLSTPGKVPLLSRADFNCPGSGKMMLDGKTSKREDENPNGDLHLDKTTVTLFNDEWDNVIDNYLAGNNDPDVIDSVSSIAKQSPVANVPPVATIERPVPEKPVVAKQLPKDEPKPIVKEPEPVKQQTVEEKYASRKKTFTKEIAVSGDSIELRFYDNAEVDGDSISLFLNDRLIFEHIRLTEQAYVIKLAVNDLHESNELTMVAENLGSIPPNTSYMVVLVGDNRYDARLESTEGASAMVRFVKKSETRNP
jgi:hypothetical protein